MAKVYSFVADPAEEGFVKDIARTDFEIVSDVDYKIKKGTPEEKDKKAVSVNLIEKGKVVSNVLINTGAIKAWVAKHSLAGVKMEGDKITIDSSVLQLQVVAGKVSFLAKAKAA